MTRTGFEHRCMDMVELTYSHYTSSDMYASHYFYTLCYSLYKQTRESAPVTELMTW
jgi:hypothetical protein